MTTRLDRMMDSLPEYYRFSQIMEAIQKAQADEYEAQMAADDDLQKQLYILTATWGLKYWEHNLNIPVVEADGYDIRRSRVLSKWRGLSSQFSATMIKSICEAYSNGTVEVTIDVAAQEITVKFISTYGVPPNIDDLKAAVENVVHAHLGTQYVYRYLIWNELDAANLMWDELDALDLTWDELEVHQF